MNHHHTLIILTCSLIQLLCVNTYKCHAVSLSEVDIKACREPQLGVSVLKATVNEEETDQLTESADLLPEVQSVPLVGDGLQHLLQGAVQLSVLLLRWPDSLTQTGEGRHLRAGIMTIRANSYRRRHRFTVANRRLKAAREQGEEGAPEINSGYGGVGEPPVAGTGPLCCSTPRKERVGRAAEGDSGPSVVRISWKHPSHFL